MEKLYCLVILGLIVISSAEGQFIFLNTGVFKFIAGLGIPIDVNMPGGSVTWFSNVQVFYKLPDNITQYEPYKVMEKRSVKNTLNRPALYQAIAKYFERLGIYGSECIHRVICEVAGRNINRKENGLLGKFIHLLFSPEKDRQHGLEEHKKAQRHGSTNSSNCETLYGDCFVNENSIFFK